MGREVFVLDSLVAMTQTHDTSPETLTFWHLKVGMNGWLDDPAVLIGVSDRLGLRGSQVWIDVLEGLGFYLPNNNCGV